MSSGPTNSRISTISRQVDIAAGVVDVHEIGDGEPILCLHGALVDWQLWRPVAELLADAGYRVVMPTLPLGAHRHPVVRGTDLRPPGLARIIVDLIDAMQLGSVTVMSNDTATALTQIVLTSHPGAAARAVLTSGDAYRWFFPPMFKPLQWLGYAPPLFSALGRGVRVPTIRNSALGFGLLAHSGISDDLGHDWSEGIIRDSAIRRDAAAVLRGISSRYTTRAARSFASVDIPVRLVWGGRDAAFPLRLAQRLQRELPNCELTVVPDSAAFLSLDAPEQLAAAVIDFLHRHPI